MGWANLWAKAKENHERSMRAKWYGKAFMIGFIFAGAGAYNLYSDVDHYIHGKPATATLMAHLKLCTVEYQLIGGPERKEQLTCDVAEAFQKRAGSNKVRLSRDSVASVSFALDDGRTQLANVDDVGTYGLPIGTTVPVVYSPDNPADVRAKLSLATLKVPLVLLAIGLPFLLLTFAGPLGTAFRWAFPRRAVEAPGPFAVEMEASKRKDALLARQAADIYPSGTSKAPRASFGLRNQ